MWLSFRNQILMELNNSLPLGRVLGTAEGTTLYVGVDRPCRYRPPKRWALHQPHDPQPQPLALSLLRDAAVLTLKI